MRCVYIRCVALLAHCHIQVFRRGGQRVKRVSRRVSIHFTIDVYCERRRCKCGAKHGDTALIGVVKQSDVSGCWEVGVTCDGVSRMHTACGLQLSNK